MKDKLHSIASWQKRTERSLSLTALEMVNASCRSVCCISPTSFPAAKVSKNSKTKQNLRGKIKPLKCTPQYCHEDRHPWGFPLPYWGFQSPVKGVIFTIFLSQVCSELSPANGITNTVISPDSPRSFHHLTIRFPILAASKSIRYD